MLKRTPIQRKPGTLKKTGKIKPRKKSDEEKQEQKDRHEKDWVFYEEMWNTKEHICASCDKPIWGELKSLYIEHILEKSVYKHLRYEPNNIAIICSDCHSKKTAGFPTEQYKQVIENTKRELL